MAKHIVLAGDDAAGHCAVGPFQNHEEALLWVAAQPPNSTIGTEWSVIPLDPPDAYRDGEPV